MTSPVEETIFDGDKYGYDRSYINYKDSPYWYKLLKDILKLGHKSGRLLVIGCNYGFFLRVCEPYFDTYGIDVSRYAIFRARDYAPRSKILLYDVQRGLPFKDENFDVVTMFDTLEHIKNYGNVLREIHRILRHEGIFLLTTPNRYSMNSILFGKDYWFKRDSSHVVLFSRDSLRETLSEAGFGETRIRTISLLHFLWDFCRTTKTPSSQVSPQVDSSQDNRSWWRRTPAPVKFCLRKAYHFVNDLPTPWGANLYASGKKQSS